MNNYLAKSQKLIDALFTIKESNDYSSFNKYDISEKAYRTLKDKLKFTLVTYDRTYYANLDINGIGEKEARMAITEPQYNSIEVLSALGELAVKNRILVEYFSHASTEEMNFSKTMPDMLRDSVIALLSDGEGKLNQAGLLLLKYAGKIAKIDFAEKEFNFFPVDKTKAYIMLAYSPEGNNRNGTAYLNLSLEILFK